MPARQDPSPSPSRRKKVFFLNPIWSTSGVWSSRRAGAPPPLSLSGAQAVERAIVRAFPGAHLQSGPPP
jgi:hypothetical protein